MLSSIAWQDSQQSNNVTLPQSVRPWLLDRSSLTQRLIDASDGDFEVELLEQSWRLPTLDESRLLGLKAREKALIREVLLRCHGEPWVYARSVLPARSLAGDLRFLRKLKNSALGALLFKDPSLKRSRFQVCRFELPQVQIPLAMSGQVYGRRSFFFLRRQPLLVAEFFLPDCKLDRMHNQPIQLLKRRHSTV